MESINIDALKIMARKFPKTVLKGVAQSGLPFQVPNKKTVKAIRNSRKVKGKRFSTVKELFKDLGI